MSLRFAFILVVIQLFLFSPGSLGQITEAVCSSSYSWASNSLGQSPCLVASYLLSTCNGGQYNISALAPGFHYLPPTLNTANPCQCSTVSYSLVAACSDCQSAPYTSWSTWSFNCTNVYISSFPNGIPSGTAVPGWAYLDVKSNDDFSPSAALAAANLPESTAAAKPTGTINTSSASTLFPTALPSATPSASSHKSNAGAIAGGVVGGLVGLGLLIGIGIWLWMRNRSARTAPSAAYLAADPLPSPRPTFMNGNQGSISYNSSAALFSGSSPPKLYDPSDPSTFPSTPATSDMYTTYSSGHHAFTSSSPGHYGGAPEI
jgi:hypothetical protein